MSVQVPLFDKGDKKASKVAAKVEEVVGAGFDVRKFVENFEVLVEAAGGIASLRRLIRLLALCGRLGAPEPRVAPGQLPATWRRMRLDEAADWAGGSGFPKNVQGHTDLPFLFCKVSDMNLPGNERFIERTAHTIDEETAKEVGARIHPAGTVVFPKIGGAIATNKRRILKRAGAIDNNCLGLTPNGHSASDYLLLFMQSIDLTTYQNDGPVPALNQGRIGAIEVPVPPLAEQKRIVAKVDQLMALCDELEAKQTKKRETGARLTKSALDALTSAEGPDEFDAAWKRVVENFDVLIDRAEKVGELRLTIMDVASHGRLVRQHENDPPATVAIATKRREIERCVGTVEVPDDRGALPPGWTWELLGNLGADAENPIQTGPFGAQLHRSDFVSEGVPVIAVGNLTGTGFTTDGLYFVTRTKAESLSRYDIHAGDLLFARSGATTGKVCVAPHFVKDWRMTGHILRVRLDPHLILPELVVYWLWGSAVVRSQIMGNIRGGTRPGYNTSLLKSIVVPVPPLAEQGRILAKIAHLMEVCDQLEERLRSVEDRASKFVEAVVRELVA